MKLPNGFGSIYKLKGKPELLNYLYLAGMGSRRSEGHGKFEILM